MNIYYNNTNNSTIQNSNLLCKLYKNVHITYIVCTTLHIHTYKSYTYILQCNILMYVCIVGRSYFM